MGRGTIARSVLPAAEDESKRVESGEPEPSVGCEREYEDSDQGPDGSNSDAGKPEQHHSPDGHSHVHAP